METVKFSLLERITNILLLNASFLDDLGLMHGKMGICIFFYHLAKKTNDKTYKDYAGELLDEIFEEINFKNQISWDFENGMAGIGWGVEYLVQNKFIEADTDKTLKQIDEHVCWRHLYASPSSIGLHKGLISIGAYYLMRIKNKNHLNKTIPALTIKYILVQFIDELARRMEKKDFFAEILDGECGPLNLKWNFPPLLFLLTNLHKLRLFNHKTDMIILALLENFKYRKNLPRFHSNRILLAEALQNLEKSSEFDNYKSMELLQNLIVWMLEDIDDSVLKKELAPVDSNLSENLFGANWIYRCLFNLPIHATQSNSSLMHKIDQDLYDTITEQDRLFPINPDWTKAFGLLNGLAGIGLQLINVNKG